MITPCPVGQARDLHQPERVSYLPQAVRQSLLSYPACSAKNKTPNDHYTNPIITMSFSIHRARHSPWAQPLHWTALLISPPSSPSHTLTCWAQSRPWSAAHAAQWLLCHPYPAECKIQTWQVWQSSSLVGNVLHMWMGHLSLSNNNMKQ